MKPDILETFFMVKDAQDDAVLRQNIFPPSLSHFQVTPAHLLIYLAENMNCYKSNILCWVFSSADSANVELQSIWLIEWEKKFWYFVIFLLKT